MELGPRSEGYQEGLREGKEKERRRCANALRKRILLWESHGGNTRLAKPYSHLTLEGELILILKDIDPKDKNWSEFWRKKP